jgi:predicted methyltransferase
MKTFFGNLGGTLPAKVTEWTGVSGDRIGAYNSDAVPESLKGKVDRVMIMREMHNLWRFDMMRREMATVWSLLDDDGLLCIEQHRASKNARAEYTNGSKGYMRERDVIALVEAQGFTFAGKSEINANKRDPANHADGVWVLPPGFRGVKDDATRARNTEIGESDRMTLVFKKRS